MNWYKKSKSNSNWDEVRKMLEHELKRPPTKYEIQENIKIKKVK